VADALLDRLLHNSYKLEQKENQWRNDKILDANDFQGVNNPCQA